MDISCVSVQGGRPGQQDRFSIDPLRLYDIEGHLLAVYDGHGGMYAVNVARNCFHRYFRPQNAADVRNAMTCAFEKLAKEMSGITCGTTLTAVCVLSSIELAVVATLGDSPVFIRKQDGSLWCNTLHNVATNKAERAAAVSRGACYYGGYISPRLTDEGLQVSRALGDAAFHEILSTTPDVVVVEKPETIVLATDGIFNDLYTDEETAENVIMLAHQTANAGGILAWRLECEAALNGIKVGAVGERALPDNTTVVVWRK